MYLHNAVEAPDASVPVQAVAMEDAVTPESLNAIETTAGTPDGENDNFKGGWTNETPKALADPVPTQDAIAIPATPATDEQAN